MALNSRYKNSMSDEFSDQSTLNEWKIVEAGVLTAKHDESGNREFLDAAVALEKIGDVNVARKEEIEKETKHDLVAAIRAMAEQVDAANPDKNYGRLIHQGITSYDTEDTATSLMLAKAGAKMLKRLSELEDALIEKAETFQFPPCLEFTHNQPAEPITVGKRFLDAAIGVREQKNRFTFETETANLCKIRGAVGIYSGPLSPQFEARVAKSLGQKVAPVATQILPIEDLLPFFNPFLTVACKIENFAQNMRLLSGAEAEIKEGFAKGQTGSSVMTFKQNPINIENITGAARKMKALYSELAHATATWRGRDISNSFQVARHIIPEMFETMEHMISRTISILKGLLVYPVQSFRNLDKYGDFLFAGAAKNYLATHLSAASNETVYSLVQQYSMDAKFTADWRGEQLSLFDMLAPHVEKTGGAKVLAGLKEVMSLTNNLRNVAGCYEVAGYKVDGYAHEKMVDYVLSTGQLKYFKVYDSLKFINMYRDIALRNNAGGAALDNAVKKFKSELVR